MKQILVLFLIMTTGSIFGEVSVVTGFINDNYTGSTENGVNGNYIGADDFLTLTLFTKSTKDLFSISEYYQVVTSRKYKYRYDLLNTEIEYKININDLLVKPRLSIINKNDFGGEFIQNSFHKFRDIPLLELEYSKSDIAFETGGIFEYRFNPLLFRLDIDVPLDIKPISSTLSLNYYLDFKYLKFDFNGGYIQYLNSQKEYSDFVRSGFIGGIQGVLKLYKGFTLNGGCFFFPTENLANDPLYKNINHNYSPQFWVTIGINGDSYNVLDVVQY